VSYRKENLLKIIETFWPVLLGVVAAFIWAVNIETISHEEFNVLATKVSVLEERMPDKKLMLTIQENQARMHAQLEGITKNLDSVTRNLEGVIEKLILGLRVK